MPQVKKLNQRSLFTFVLSLLLFISCNARADDIPQLPWGFSVKWDISQKNNQLVQDFIVNKKDPFTLWSFIFAPSRQFQEQEHSYKIALTLEFSPQANNSKKLMQLEKFLGGNDKDGIIIPVSLKIDRVEGGHIVPVVPKKVIDSYGMDGHGATSVSRIIEGYISLSAGKYRITISTTHPVKLVPGVQSSLVIYDRSK